MDLDIEFVQSGFNSSAVLLFHGLTGSPYELRKYAKMLHENGLDVYCYCLAGHGNHKISIYDVSFYDWVNFACEKYEALRRKYKNFYTGGLCLGALLALHLAQNYDTITGVICLSTTLYLDGWTIPKYSFLLPLGFNTILKYYYTFMEREPFGIKNKIVRKKIAKLMQNNTVALDNYPLSAVYELLLLSKKVRQNIEKVKSPVLVVHSKEDDLTSTKSADFVYENISSIIKEKVILNNSYHLVLYDNEKEVVYEKTLDFIELTKQMKYTLTKKEALL